MKLDKIVYNHLDLINLIKNNTGLIVNCDPRDLYVDIQFKSGKFNIEVFRKDKKELEISL